MIRGCVVVDLTAEPEISSSLDRRQLDVLARCPDGVRVIVDIGSRQYVTDDAASWLYEHGSRLELEVHGTSPGAVARFVAAARSGGLSVVA